MASVSPDSLPKLSKQLFELMLPTDPLLTAAAEAKKAKVLKEWAGTSSIKLV